VSGKIQEFENGSEIKYTLNIPNIELSEDLCNYEDGDVYDYDSRKYRVAKVVNYTPMEFILPFFHKKENDVILTDHEKVCLSLQNSIKEEENKDNPKMLNFLNLLLETAKQNEIEKISTSNPKEDISPIEKNIINEKNLIKFISKSIPSTGTFSMFKDKGEKYLFGSIVEFLPIKSVLKLSECSKGIFELCNTDYVWNILARNNGGVFFENQGKIKDCFIKSFKMKKIHYIDEWNALNTENFQIIRETGFLNTDKGLFKLVNPQEAENIYENVLHINEDGKEIFYNISSNRAIYSYKNIELCFTLSKMGEICSYAPPIEEIDPLTNEKRYIYPDYNIYYSMTLKKDSESK